MTPSGGSPSIREDDVEARPLRRRAFLGRFGVAAGVAGVLGWTAGCAGSGSGQPSDACDDDPGDPADSDPSDPADSDSGDPCDSD